MSTKRSFYVIINPISGNGKAKKVWQNIEPELNLHFNIKFCFTKHANHEIELTKQAINEGYKHFIIIGGDGTLNKFINGLFSQQSVNPNTITFGLIPIVTGNDWVKTHHIPKNINRALKIIIDGKTDTQDVGCIEYLNSSTKTYFINLCGIGFDGLVVNIVKNNRTFGKFTYLLGALKGLFIFKKFDAQIIVNSKTTSYDSCFLIQLGICKYTGSGMQLTDLANPKDGLLDVTLASNFTKWDVLKNIISLFNGKIVHHKKVETLKTEALHIKSSAKNTYMQADGEPLNFSEINVCILPKAIQFYC